MWWDNNDLGVAPKIAEVKTTITSAIFAQMGQVRSSSASIQGVDIEGLVAR